MRAGILTNLLASLSLVLLASGCASTSYQQSQEKPPPKANRVQVVMYDTTPRPPTTRLDVYGMIPPQRPHRIIALLTCEGAVDQEAVMTRAIFYRARQLGADAVQNAGTINSVREGYYFFYYAPRMRSVFRYYALVYTDK